MRQDNGIESINRSALSSRRYESSVARAFGGRFSSSHRRWAVAENALVCMLFFSTCPCLSGALRVNGFSPVVSSKIMLSGGSGSILSSQSWNRKISSKPLSTSSRHSSFFALHHSKNDDATSSTSTASTDSDIDISSSSSPLSATTTSLTSPHDETKVYEKAISRTLISVAFSTLVGVVIFYMMGGRSAEEFFTAYVVELSLSVDNLFVFLILFDFFQVPLRNQNRVLNYGILGSVVMRAIMIGLGSAMLERFKGVLLIFAGVLIYSSVIALLPSGDDEEEEDMTENAIVKFSQSLFPTTEFFDKENFFTLVDGIKMATPLLICLIAIELSDVVFAVDSIPAVFGVTNDPFIVFTSNMCAILGLRSLYTILSKAASELIYLENSVALVLGFIGFKMIAEFMGYCISMNLSLIVVLSLLGCGIGLSLLFKDTDESIIDV